MKFIKVIRTIYRKNFSAFSDFIFYFKKELSDCDSVLDLGCGSNSPIQYCKIPFTVGVELFDTYLEESKKKGIHNQYIKGDITKIDFKPKSFDAVIATDVLEHLSKKDGHELLKKMEKWVKKKIIILTPNGYMYQDGSIDNNPLQEHKSGWSVEEFQKLGFKVFGMLGWKKLRGYRALVKYKPTYLWIVISDITQKMLYYYPRWAFHLFAVKEINSNNS